MSQERLPATKMGISVILEIEILSYPHLTVDDEQQIKIILSSLTHSHLSDEIKEQTIKLKLLLQNHIQEHLDYMNLRKII